jgi:hypothetical protein
MADASQVIDYEAGDPGRRAKVRRRRLVGLVMLVALVAGGWWGGAAGYRRVLRSYWEYRVEHYVAPSGRVVYEEDPQRWPALLAQANYRNLQLTSPGWSPFVVYMSPAVERLREVSGLRIGETALFAHSRRTPDGRERLVVVWMAYNAVRADAQGASPDNQVCFDLFISVVDGAKLMETMPSLWIAPTAVAENRQAPLYARMFAGQIDPHDATHFVIPFEIGEYGDVLDGHLRDDLTVALRPRKLEHPMNPK